MRYAICKIAVIYSLLSAIGLIVLSISLSNEEITALMFILSLVIGIVQLVLIWGLYFAYVRIDELESKINPPKDEQEQQPPQNGQNNQQYNYWEKR